MDITIDNLIIEVTRRCNMCCDHCIRGDAEDMDMDLSIIDKLLDSEVNIQNVVFTGGEPTLNVEAIKYFADRLEARHKNISSFYVKTNGKIESLDLMIALMRLYALCDFRESCLFEISNDQYHDGYEPELYKALAFYHHNEYKMYEDSQIFSEGHAYANGIGERLPESSGFEFNDLDDPDTIQLRMLQISANGNVCGQCDISFERADKETLGNMLTGDLREIVSKEYYAQQIQSQAA